jgi:hypothetical protein
VSIAPNVHRFLRAESSIALSLQQSDIAKGSKQRRKKPFILRLSFGLLIGLVAPVGA